MLDSIIGLLTYTQPPFFPDQPPSPETVRAGCERRALYELGTLRMALAMEVSGSGGAMAASSHGTGTG